MLPKKIIAVMGEKSDMTRTQIYYGGKHQFTGTARYKGDELIQWSCMYSLTKGKVYQFVDGHFIDDEGRTSQVVMEIQDLRMNGFIVEV